MSEVNQLPTYGYECTKCKEKFEVFQRITEDALTIHDDCGGELRRLLYPVGIVFKGPGFHVNDYGKNGKTSSQSTSTDKSEAKTESKVETKSETKTDSKPETASAGSKDS